MSSVSRKNLRRNFRSRFRYSALSMSGNVNAPADNGNNSSSLAIARETRVLSELAASVHTLESISQLLDQIAVLTGAPEDEARSSGTGDVGSKKRPAGPESVATKQMALMEELGKWGELMGSGTTAGTDQSHHDEGNQVDGG